MATARMTAYVNWLVEMDPDRKGTLKRVVDELQESEIAMKAKMGDALNDAHLVLGGPPGLSLPSIHAATNISSSSLQAETSSSSAAGSQDSQPTTSPMTIRIPSLKRPRPEHAQGQVSPDVHMDVLEVQNQLQQVRHDLLI